MELPIHGESYNKEKDHKRIQSIRQRIWDLMDCGLWFTLQDIREELDLYADSDISRRLREMRDLGYKLFKERTEISGVWIYKAVKKGK